MTSPAHEFRSRCTGGGGKGKARVAKIVKAQVSTPHC
jgi:hypothetical protein